MNTLSSVCIGDYYTPQPMQQEFHESERHCDSCERIGVIVDPNG
jgi:hypothetical protein